LPASATGSSLHRVQSASPGFVFICLQQADTSRSSALAKKGRAWRLCPPDNSTAKTLRQRSASTGQPARTAFADKNAALRHGHDATPTRHSRAHSPRRDFLSPAADATPSAASALGDWRWR